MRCWKAPLSLSIRNLHLLNPNNLRRFLIAALSIRILCIESPGCHSPSPTVPNFVKENTSRSLS